VANTAQAKKRARQAVTRRARNFSRRSQVRRAIKQALEAVQGEDKAAAEQTYRQTVSVIDRMAGKGILHRNAAARYKSRLNAQVRAIKS
jgi:small subunit ribosomal protein S20